MRERLYGKGTGKGNDPSARDCESNHHQAFILQKRLYETSSPGSLRSRFLSPMSNHEDLCAVSRSNILPLKARKACANVRGPSTRMKGSDTWRFDGTLCRWDFSVTWLHQLKVQVWKRSGQSDDRLTWIHFWYFS